MARIAVVGDVGGHLRCLRTALSRLGVDVERLVLPEDLVVVQVGDLVGGPDDAAVVAFVDDLSDENPGRWVQLAGNWEGRSLGGPVFSSRREVRPLDPASANALRLWAEGGFARLAVALSTARRGPVLVTHAGLTAGYWEELGAPDDAAVAAVELNRLLRDEPRRAFRPGVMLGGGATCAGSPGPAWAMAGCEVYPSWLDRAEPPPFGQVHGHTSPYFFGGRRWSDDVPPRVSARARVNEERRHVWLEVGGRPFVGVDPGLGRRPRGDELHALVLEGEVLGGAPAAGGRRDR